MLFSVLDLHNIEMPFSCVVVIQMKINTINDIRTAIQNSGLNEHFETLDLDEFVQFCWDNMDGMELELDDLFKDFEECKATNCDEWYA